MVTDHEMRMEGVRLLEENERLRALLRDAMAALEPFARCKRGEILTPAPNDWRDADTTLAKLKE